MGAAVAAVGPVVAGVEDVVAVEPKEVVVPRAAGNRVRIVVARQRVGARAAYELVRVGGDVVAVLVVGAAADVGGDRIGPVRVADGVEVRADVGANPEEVRPVGTGPGAAAQGVVAVVAAAELVGPSVPCELVVAEAAGEVLDVRADLVAYVSEPIGRGRRDAKVCRLRYQR